ncbi:amino acid adenylation domain-containing protein (plasmid) [Pseudoalteromonas sp. T1lg65]|uniref:non-ribosomal peptide synthetase n=1 Tax=Pseudoalteromonas sp. T1lg65 TaxID=2077101 RepID=UPI003F7B0EE7
MPYYAYVAPSNEREVELCRVWQLVLELEQVGVNDNFFQIGGNANNAIKLINTIRVEMSMAVPLAVLFEHSTVAKMAAFLNHPKEFVDVTSVQQQEYWASQLSGVETLELPTDCVRPLNFDDRGQYVEFELDEALSTQLSALAQSQYTTLYTVLLSGFYVTLTALSGQSDIVIGTPSDSRFDQQRQSTNEFFVNSLALRADVQGKQSLQALISHVKHVVNQARVHQGLSFEKVPELLGVERDTSRHPIFQVMFDLASVDSGAIDLPALPIEGSEASTTQSSTDLDLSLSLIDSGKVIRGSFNYAVSLFEASSIERMRDMYFRVLQALVNDVTQTVAQVDVLSEQERHQLLYQWNDTDAAYPQDKTLQALFEEQAVQTPEQVAVVFAGEALSYGELNERANQLAHAIRAEYEVSTGKALSADTFIGLYVARSVEMVVSILAVLKAGAAYVPISPEYPSERVEFILSDTQASLVLTQSQYQQTLSALTTASLMCVDDRDTYAAHSTAVPAAINDASDLAYVIYTSGTTGKPKGVMIEHRSVVNLIDNQYRELDFTADEVVIWLANYIFDASVEQFFLPLLNGSRLVVPSDDEITQPEKIIQHLITHQVTHLDGTPSYLQALGHPGSKSAIRRVIAGGESLISELRSLWGDLLINEYGPTEVTVTSIQCLDSSNAKSLNTIGTPISNTRAYVVNDAGQLAAMNTPGELYLGGVGVARGYLNRDDLTGASFIDNPFASEADKAKGYTRLYKTGDLVRWQENGQLEYLGRNDSQVKIRGYRIELGEIESALNEVADIAQAVVIDKVTGSNKYLAAYVVVQAGKTLSIDSVREQLSGRLPDYMVPSTFTELEQLPLTINGKLDKRALPEPALVDGRNYVAPRNTLETQLCELWQAVLELEQVGVHDNFFRIGGNSINAIKLTARIREALSMDVPLALLLTHKTVAGIAAHLNDQNEMLVIPHRTLEQAPLSFAQESLLFIERFEQGSHIYHIPSLVQLSADADIDKLVEAINVVATRHPVMKSVYRTDEAGADYQLVLAQDIELERHVLDSESALLASLSEAVATPFDLTTEMSLKLHHFVVEEDNTSKGYLLMLWHHIGFDGWSIDIFMSELNETYDALIADRNPELPELEISYADYASWQRDHLSGEVLVQQQDYWQTQLSGFETLVLPTDHSRPPHIDYRGQDVAFELDKALSEQLRAVAQSQETTLYTVLLSGFYVTLAALSGQDDIVIGTPSDNRHHAQTQSLIGFFVNSLVLRAGVNGAQSLSALIAQVHGVVTQAKVHQELPFEKLVDLLDVERDPSRHPVYQVMFSVQDFDYDKSQFSTLPFDTTTLLNEHKLFTPANYDLRLFLSDKHEQISGYVNYAVSLFEAASIERMLEMYRKVLQALVSDVTQTVAQVDLLSSEERHQLLHRWNDTDKPYPQDKTLSALFEAQAAKTPEQVALVFENETLSYGELNERANQLAHAIRARYESANGQALSADTFIGLYMDRSLAMVVSILAVLKAGAAYVPVSPEYPQERVEFILSDTQTDLVLTQTQYQAELSTLTTASLLLVDDAEVFSGQSSATPEAISDANDLAYVIYTSGTTGKPKGVMIEHRNVAHLVTAQRQHFECDAYQNALWFADYVFDASVSELFVSLLSGHTLFISSTETRKDPSKLAALLSKENIQLATLPPAILHQLDAGCFASFECLVMAGEAPTIELYEKFNAIPRLLNAYGPTESTVCASVNRYQQGDSATNIGHAIPNSRLYVLSDSGNLAPINVVGELYISGAGLARGYLNRDDLTAESFINNPFASEADKAKGYTRLYKTGDLVRRLADGRLEFLGRNDSQVKIRGYRVELGEIESALNGLADVAQAVVVDKVKGGNKYLAAYVVAEAGHTLSLDGVRAQLSTQLPDYMVPAAFTELEHIPLTINGKVDKRALPAPSFVSEDEYVAPRNELEAQLCELWQDVLGVEQVGVHDNFFRIGGNSINAIKLTAAIRDVLSVDVPLALLFEYKTVAGLAAQLGEQDELLVIPRSTLAQAPLSFAQERLLFIERFEQGSDVYHIPSLVKLNSDAELDKLLTAINVVATRHPVMKSVYHTNDAGEDYQVVLAQDIELERHVLDSESTLLASLSEAVATPFDLTTEMSLKLHHFVVEGDNTSKGYLLMLWHHIGFDGWSIDIFMSELDEAYDALIADRNPELPELEISYTDYASWQRDYLTGEVLEQQQGYWQTQLSGFETLVLPTDHSRPAHIDYRGQDIAFELDEALSEQLRALAQSQETTLYTVLLSGFYVTLAALSGQDDIVIGTPSDNRHHAQTQSLIGFFVNSLALRAGVNGAQSLSALIAQVHGVVTQAKVHQELPFEKLVDLLDVERDSSRHPIYQVLFDLASVGTGDNSASNLPFAAPPLDSEQSLYSPAKFDLSLSLVDSVDAIHGNFNYAVSLFEAASIERMLEMYRKVLQALVSDVTQTVAQVDLLSSEERHQLLHTWNDTKVDYPQSATINTLVEAQSGQTPDNIALVFGDNELTYRALNERANQLAHHLVELGVGADTYVAVCIERSLDMVIGMLAILKAGGAYVPLDLGAPLERLEYMLEDSGASFVLTTSEIAAVIEFPVKVGVVCIDMQDTWVANPVSNLRSRDGITPQNLAYIIYTSGSTGKPKGVMVEHRNVVNFFTGLDSSIGSERAQETWLAVTSISFDISVLELFWTLSRGQKVVLQPGRPVTLSDGTTPEIQRILARRTQHGLTSQELILQHGVTHLQCTPSFMQELISDSSAHSALTQLEKVLLGGEALSPELANAVIGRISGSLYNMYGPTETTIWSSVEKVTSSHITIGYPIANTQLYVIGTEGQLLPAGAQGELYIGGEGVSRRYLNRPDLTADKFIDSPFTAEQGARLYKTGDLVRRLKDGRLEYLGRNDSQVKIRGYRIELGEVESALVALSNVKQAVVVDKQQAGQKFLAAYIVPEQGEVVDIEQIREEISVSLPEYMVPSAFALIASVPLNVNGKTDRRALPEPNFVDAGGYVAPRNELEAQLCELWQNVLELEQVGVNDNFFRIGGNSIRAIRLTAAIRDVLSVDVPLALLFEYKTVAGLATQLVKQDEMLVIPQSNLEQAPLSFAQERLLFIERFEQGSDVYHIPSLVKLNSDADLDKLLTAINVVATRHPVMKSVYRTDEAGADYQLVLAQDIELERHVLDGESTLLASLSEAIATPFDLTTEMSLRLHHFVVEGDNTSKGYLLMLWHHIGFDGWSADIFMSELEEAYHALLADRAAELPALEISYADYASWQRDYLTGEVLEKQQGYWQTQLSGFEHLTLPTDYARPATIDYRGKDIEFELDVALSEQLRALAQSQDTTLYTILLSGFYVTLAALSGQDDIVIGTPSDNRHHAQTQSLIGFFVNSLALRAEINGEQSLKTLIKHVHNVVTQAKVHQELPFEKLVDLLDVERDPSRHPIYQVMFSMEQFNELDMAAKSLPFMDTDLGLERHVYNPAKFDLSLSLVDGDRTIQGNFNYALSLFEAASIERVLTVYRKVLQAFASDVTQAVVQVDVLSVEERYQLLHQWNDTDSDYPEDEMVHTLFEAQAAKTPGQVALVFEDEALSYAELNERANQLAHAIRSEYESATGKVLSADTFVGVYMKRSAEMVVSILAVLKAGGAYVPISPDYPKERVEFILSDTQADLVLTQSQYQPELETLTTASLIRVDEAQVYSGYSKNNLATRNQASDLAYVIYTSGTTGKPKGVLAPHQGVVSLVQDTNYVELSSSDVFLHLSDPCFDAATFEIWGALTLGAKVVIYPGTESITPDEVNRLLKTQAVSVLFLTRTLFDNLYLQNDTMFGKLRYLLTGGEALTPSLIRKLVNQSSRPKHILNVYGPTESTTFTTAYQCGSFSGSVPLGRAINTRKVYVLTKHKTLAPVNVVGELYISGAGLARGYLNRPELTNDCFIDNPFASEADKAKGYTKLYKTGDLMRWLPDGNLEYIGRNDDQIKIRGYRIELGEIENALNRLPGIAQSVVIDKVKGDSKYLAAYLVANSGQTLSLDGLREQLSEQLPDYMVPDAFTELEHIPLTLNGKLDKRALPEPNFVRADEYVAPRNELEAQLCMLWQTVLELDQVGVHDNFFRIGGNSINAIKLTAAIREALSIDVPLALLFEYKTVAGLAAQLSKQGEMLVIPRNTRAHAPLSFAQERLLFIERFEQGSDVYHIPSLVKLNSDADLDKLLTAINVVATRHSVIKSVYRTNDTGQDCQVVLTRDIELERHVLDSESTLLSKISETIASPFDLTSEVSLKLHHFVVEGDNTSKGHLLMLWHHIGFDGWSSDIFMSELDEAYYALIANRTPELPELEISYADYASWQRDYLTGEVLEQQQSYWQTQLSGVETLVLPTDRARPARIDHRGQNVALELDVTLSNKLRALAQSQETTLNTVLLSGFYVTLAALSGQDDIVIGTPSDNRHHAQTQSLIGFFVNSLALRAGVNGAQSLSALIAHVHGVVTQAKVHQELPFERVVDLLDVERDQSRHPIYQVMFSFERFGEQKVINNALPFQPTAFDNEENLYKVAKFDLSLSLADNDSVIRGYFNYAVSLFEVSSIERIRDMYCKVLQALVSDVTQTVAQVDVLSAQERHQLLHTWNDTEAAYPQDTTLHALFEAQAAKTPEQVALVFEGESLSYGELNERANQLAHAIRAEYEVSTGKALSADSFIGLYVARSVEMVVSILAVLKSGAAYVPISPDYPSERVEFILSDTQASVVLTQSQYQEKLSALTSARVVRVDDGEVYGGQCKANPEAVSHASDLAYVIYTSGTTGKPKGVMIEHRSIVNTLFSMSNVYNISEQYRRSSCFSNYVFDVSVSEIFNSLCFGGELHIFSEAVRTNVTALQTYMIEKALNFVFLPPAILSVLPRCNYPSLQALIFAGEPCDKEAGQYWSSHYALHNYYGPTEATVYASGKQAQARNVNEIGRPLSNMRLYVLDKAGAIVPVNAPGELYISGIGLARGYLNRDELTASSFIENPFASEAEKAQGYDRLYKTGDLVRWLADGHLEYLGRNDNQVKIRGYRIELGEIESALTGLPEVAQAVVLVREHEGKKQLAAYLVGSEGVVLDVEACRAKLGGVLPAYMQPNSFTVLAAMPLTVNGKVDKRALPEPQFVNEDEYVAPRNALEAQLCEIWQEVLGLKRVGVNDNFFRIGGDSIVSIQLVTKLRKLGFDIQVKAIFDAPDVARLALLLSKSTEKVETRTEQGLLEGEFGLLPIQEWFFDKALPKAGHWNQAFMVKLPSNITQQQVEVAVRQLAAHHDMLRCEFKLQHDKMIQRYSSDVCATMAPLRALDVSNLDELSISQVLTSWQSNFNVVEGPLWQAGYLTGYADGSARLFFAFHHLIIDAYSWRIIAEDIKQLLQGKSLDKKGSSYRQWVETVKFYSRTHQHEVAYWNRVADCQTKSLPHHELRINEVVLPESSTDVLLHQANLGFNTEINDLLLSALAVALAKTFKRNDNSIMLEGHGREMIDESIDISQTVGWFTTAYPIKLVSELNLKETIVKTKEMLRDIPNKGLGYGALVQSGSLSSELPKIIFNYLGQFNSGSKSGLPEDWSLVSEDCGEMISRENTEEVLLNINGSVSNGSLGFQIQSQLDATQTELFIQNFESALLMITQEAAEQALKGGIKTQSDFGFKTASDRQLQSLYKNNVSNTKKVVKQKMKI